MARTARYWRVNENNLSVGGFAVMLLFAVMMFWVAPLLRKHSLRPWAIAVEFISAVGLVVCVIHAFI